MIHNFELRNCIITKIAVFSLQRPIDSETQWVRLLIDLIYTYHFFHFRLINNTSIWLSVSWLSHQFIAISLARTANANTKFNFNWTRIDENFDYYYYIFSNIVIWRLSLSPAAHHNIITEPKINREMFYHLHFCTLHILGQTISFFFVHITF